jgi:peroxiredoxin Q/BCP
VIDLKTAAIVLLLIAALAPVALAQPAAGSKAPAFSLPAQDGAAVSLDQFSGHWIVLYFYPKDFGTGCTIEAHNFQRDLAKYQQKNAVVLGVSVNTVESHKDFCGKEGLNFKLLADADHKVAEQYGVVTGMLQKYASRVTLLIDPRGTIRKVYTKVDPAHHSDEVLADLGQIQAAK